MACVRLKDWGAFLLLGSIWGSSFLWIKIAVADVSPPTLAAFRLLFGLIGLLVVARLARQTFTTVRTHWRAYLFMGFFNAAFPFILINWAETRIDSALAAILNATVPLFAFVIAHFWQADEKITPARTAGLVTGFIGVIVLVSREFSPQGVHGNLWGQIAMLVASMSYALTANFSRRHLRGHPPLVQATMVVLFADAITWTVALATDRPFGPPSSALTWFALAWLGLLGSCVAYLLYFYLINTVGASRSSLVTYVFPVIGLVLGIVFLNEVADWHLLVGSALVIGGIVVVGRPPRSRLVSGSREVAQES
jgi:drug/metabolite transporter (DMT)-like permease